MNVVKIGVTGHRFLDETNKLRGGIDTALKRIDQVYLQKAWTVLSSLADGADQLMVDCVLKFKSDTRLIVPLPMKVNEFTNNFLEEESRIKFHQLLHNAEEVIPPPLNWHQNEGYWEAGRYIVDHCDVLIALWDGQTAQGHGGTGDVVNMAKASKKPLVWVNCYNNNPGKRLNEISSSEQGLVTYMNFPENA